MHILPTCYLGIQTLTFNGRLHSRERCSPVHHIHPCPYTCFPLSNYISFKGKIPRRRGGGLGLPVLVVSPLGPVRLPSIESIEGIRFFLSTMGCFLAGGVYGLVRIPSVRFFASKYHPPMLIATNAFGKLAKVHVVLKEEIEMELLLIKANQ